MASTKDCLHFVVHLSQIVAEEERVMMSKYLSIMLFWFFRNLSYTLITSSVDRFLIPYASVDLYKNFHSGLYVSSCFEREGKINV